MQPVSKSRHYISNLQLCVLMFCFNVTLTPFGIFRNHKSIQIKSLNIVKINKIVVICLQEFLRSLIPFRNSVTTLRRGWHDFTASDGDNSVLNTTRTKTEGIRNTLLSLYCPGWFNACNS